MNDWKERLKVEYTELKERIEKLHKWNIKQEVYYRMGPSDTNGLDDLNRYLCRDQEDAMNHYLHILELRAETYGTDLNQ